MRSSSKNELMTGTSKERMSCRNCLSEEDRLFCPAPNTIVISADSTKDLKSRKRSSACSSLKDRRSGSSACNHLLGHAHEDRNVLLAAIRYLDKHAPDANIISIDKGQN